MKEYAFGIDLGGTTAKIGLFKTTGELLEKWEVPTDTSNAGEHILKNLAAAVQGKMQEKGLAAAQVEGVGVGVLLTALYTLLYAILQMEDYALLMGTALVLVMLGALMMVSRNLAFERM